VRDKRREGYQNDGNGEVNLLLFDCLLPFVEMDVR
jgi:hypothetical protein